MGDAKIIWPGDNANTNTTLTTTSTALTIPADSKLLKACCISDDFHLEVDAAAALTSSRYKAGKEHLIPIRRRTTVNARTNASAGATFYYQVVERAEGL